MSDYRLCYVFCLWEWTGEGGEEGEGCECTGELEGEEGGCDVGGGGADVVEEGCEEVCFCEGGGGPGGECVG